MKRLLYLLTAMLTLLGSASVMSAASSSASDLNTQKAKVAAVVGKYSKRDDFESVRFGSFATAAMRTMIRLGGDNDPESKKAMKIFSGMKSFHILDYSDCSSSVRASFDREFGAAVSGYDMLIEAKDEGEKMTIYALVNERKSEVVQIIMKTDDAVIIMDGSIDLNTLAEATRQMQ